MSEQIKVPDIGDFDRVPVIEILVEVGDTLEAEQSLLTLESDKATMEVPSPVDGTLLELKVKVGDEVGEGDVIALVEVADTDSDQHAGAEDSETETDSNDEAVSGEDHKTERAEANQGSEQEVGAETRHSETDAPEQSADSNNDRAAETETGADNPSASTGVDDLPAPPVPFDEMGRDPSSIPHASPGVRKLARELGADLTAVNGSARHGRITEEDLKQHVKSRLESGATAADGAGMKIANAPEVDFAKFGEIDRQPLSRIQKISGPNLHRNWVTIPHVTQFDQADITDMEAFRKASKHEAEQAGTKMTPLVFLIKAVVAGLKEFPAFNASLSADGQSLIYKQYFHIGFAADTPHGLMVPVIRDCDQKSLLELAKDLTELSGRARDGKLSREQMQGGCMSISSLGGIGGTAFTPIINAPEVAILGVSRSEMKPVWNGEQFVPRLMLPLSLSYDHRVIDGALAARFTGYLAHVLSDIRRLML